MQGLQPIAHDPASGEIQLARRDWTVSVKRGLDKSGGALSGIGWTDWLNGGPNPTIWPGTEIFPNGRAVDPSRKPYWWKLPRFGFAIGQDTESRFIRLGADGRIVMEPGQPELDGFITYDNTRLVFDPGQGEPIAVAASGRRLVLIAADGKTRPLACGSHCALGWINTLESDLSNPAGVLIGAQAGLFRHTPDAGFEQILPISVTGPVFAIETVPQLAETIVEAGFGRFICPRSMASVVSGRLVAPSIRCAFSPLREAMRCSLLPGFRRGSSCLELSRPGRALIRKSNGADVSA